MGEKRKRSFKDLSGQRFSRLLVLHHDTSCVKYIKFVCQCDCGIVKSVRSFALTSGLTKSCGCLGLEALKNEAKKQRNTLIGQVFGLLTVIEATDKRTSSGGLVWKCMCACGTVCVSPGSRLTHSKTTGQIISCGCRNKKLFLERAANFVANYRLSKGNSATQPLSPRRVILTAQYEASGLKQVILERDAYTCQLCNKVGGSLHIHHLIPVSQDPELAADPANLVCLCKECHVKKIHLNGNLWKVDSTLTEQLIARLAGRSESMFV